MIRAVRIALLAASASAALGACAYNEALGRSQLLIVPESQVIQASEQYYAQQRTQASSAGVLLTSGPEFQRVRDIMQRIVPQVRTLRPESAWNVSAVTNWRAPAVRTT